MGAHRILIISGRPLFREGLSSLLRGEVGLEVVGAVGDAGIARDGWPSLAPDVVILDRDDVKPSDLETLLSAKDRRVKVIVLSWINEDMAIYHRQPLRRANLETLLEAIRSE